jgi:hypothetical protein
MQGPYVAVIDAVSVSAATDIFHGTVAADRPAQVLGMALFQTSEPTTEEETLRIGFLRGVTGGSGGTAATEQSYGDSDTPAATTAILTLNSTPSTGGTLLEPQGWNLRVPYLWMPIPEIRGRIDATEDPFAFRLLAAPTDAITLSGALWWFEL